MIRVKALDELEYIPKTHQTKNTKGTKLRGLTARKRSDLISESTQKEGRDGSVTIDRNNDERNRPGTKNEVKRKWPDFTSH